MTTPRDNDSERTTSFEQTPAGGPVVPPSQTGPVVPAGQRSEKLKSTRISGTWIAVIISILVLIVLLIFILQNLDDVTVHFLGTATTLPLGVALLFSAIAGAIAVALVGGARIVQLRRQAKRRSR